MTTPSDPSTGPSEPTQQPAPEWGPPPGWAAPPPQTGYGPPPGYGTPPAYGGGPGYGAPGGVTSEDTMWGILVHLSYFVAGILAPLVVYLIKKDSSPFVRRHAAEALNFHLTLTLAAIVSAVLIIVIIGFVLLLAVLVVGAVFAVVAAVAAGRGEEYRYPMTIRFVT